jgi:RNA polymerase sigma-70 factor (ECF subfamily)
VALAWAVKARTDVELVEAACRGDVASFSELYERHYAAVVGVAYAILGDRHLAEDAAQETFALACRQLQGLRKPAKFASWLAGICRNVAKGLRRRRHRHIPAQAVPDRLDDDERAAVDQAVRQAVMCLTRPAREVVVLHYFAGLSHKRVAAALGISPEAVHGRLVRARRRLGRELKAMGLSQGEDYDVAGKRSTTG